MGRVLDELAELLNIKDPPRCDGGSGCSCVQGKGKAGWVRLTEAGRAKLAKWHGGRWMGCYAQFEGEGMLWSFGWGAFPEPNHQVEGYRLSEGDDYQRLPG